jgi:hypothetical protein
VVWQHIVLYFDLFQVMKLHVHPDDDHRSKHVGAFKCFNVCFRIIQYILVHLLVLIIGES